MVFMWCQDSELPLRSVVGVVRYVRLYRVDEFLPRSEFPAVVHLALQDAPETFHRPVVCAVRNARHALRHARLHELVVEVLVRVLEAAIAVEQGMRVRMSFHGLVKGLEDQRVVVPVANHVGHRHAVAEIEDEAQIDLLRRSVCRMVLELRHVRDPFLVASVSVKITAEYVFRRVVRIDGRPSAAVVPILYNGAQLLLSADAQDALVVDVQAVVVLDLVTDSPVAHVGIFFVDIYCQFRQMVIQVVRGLRALDNRRPSSRFQARTEP